MLGLCVVVEQTIEELVPVVVEVVVDADVSLEAIVEWRGIDQRLASDLQVAGNIRRSVDAVAVVGFILCHGLEV